jgi:uncharacterized protein (TIGR04255 family)
MTAPKVRRHYNRAPITEAVIDIRFETKDTVSVGDVERISDGLRTEFSTKLPLYQLQMGFQVNPGAEPEFSKDHLTLGYRLDRTGRVLQFRTNGYTYSHLPPYTDWPTFSAEAEKYWNQYKNELNPVRASRVAVRMINRVPLPPGDFRLDSCLNLYPAIPDSLPPNLHSLVMQLQIPMKHVDEAAIAILQLYSAPPVSDSHSIMLDIDFIVEKPIPIEGVFELLNILGDAKDDIFEACITDTVRKLIS